MGIIELFWCLPLYCETKAYFIIIGTVRENRSFASNPLIPQKNMERIIVKRLIDPATIRFLKSGHNQRNTQCDFHRRHACSSHH